MFYQKALTFYTKIFYYKINLFEFTTQKNFCEFKRQNNLCEFTTKKNDFKNFNLK